MAGPGALVAVGGAEDKRGQMVVLRRALDEAPAAKRVAIVPTASRDPLWASELHVAAFRQLGVEAIDLLDVRTRDDAAHEPCLDALRAADLVYMTGGDQARLADVLASTPFADALREKVRGGGVVAGTSAGAAAMSSVMIARGDTSLRAGSVRLASGLGLLPGAIVDTHFSERGRFARLLAAVAAHPKLLGIGVGEDTAIVVRGADVEVIGSGSVVVVDAREMVDTNAADAEPGEPVHAERLIVHTYAAGHAFRLETPRAAGAPGRGRARA